MAAMKEKSLAKELAPHPEGASGREKEVLPQQSSQESSQESSQQSSQQPGPSVTNSHEDSDNVQSSQSESQSSGSRRVMDEEIKEAVSLLTARLDAVFGGKKNSVSEEREKNSVSEEREKNSVSEEREKRKKNSVFGEKRKERLMMKVASAANTIKMRIVQSGKMIQREVMEELKMVKKDLELQDSVNAACEKIVENSAKSVERMNRLRLIQEELLDGKQQVAKTRFYRKVYEDALAVFGCDENTVSNGQSTDRGQETTSDGQEKDGQEKDGQEKVGQEKDGQEKDGAGSIKTGQILSLAIETQDLIRLYNKLVKDKK